MRSGWRRRPHVIAVIGATLSVLSVDTAVPTGAEEPNRGQQIAVQRCGVCHATDATSPSPQKITPPFRELHQRFPIDMLVEAVNTGVVSGHDEMPMFQFSMEDAQALVGYIDSLSPPSARYVKK